MAPRLTTPGTYVVESFGPYQTKTWQWSRLAWGTPLRVEADGRLLFRESRTGEWRSANEVIPEITLGDV